MYVILELDYVCNNKLLNTKYYDKNSKIYINRKK